MGDSKVPSVLDDPTRREPPFVYLEMEMVYHAQISVPGGYRTYTLTEEEFAQAKRDELGFAAKTFGLTKIQYREWLDCDGYAKCGHRKPNGEYCGIIVSGQKDDFVGRPVRWMAKHRKVLCKHHQPH